MRNQNVDTIACQADGYLEVRGRQVAAEDRWWLTCDAKHLPYVVVRKNRKTAEVELDLLSARKELDDPPGAEAHRLLKSYGTQGSSYYAGTVVTKLRGIRIEHVDKVARALLALAERAHVAWPD